MHQPWILAEADPERGLARLNPRRTPEERSDPAFSAKAYRFDRSALAAGSYFAKVQDREATLGGTVVL